MNCCSLFLDFHIHRRSYGPGSAEPRTAIDAFSWFYPVMRSRSRTWVRSIYRRLGVARTAAAVRLLRSHMSCMEPPSWPENDRLNPSLHPEHTRKPSRRESVLRVRNERKSSERMSQGQPLGTHGILARPVSNGSMPPIAINVTSPTPFRARLELRWQEAVQKRVKRRPGSVESANMPKERLLTCFSPML